MADTGSDSFRSTLSGGCDFLYGCDVCDQGEGVGYCGDCQKHLCTGCFNNHLASSQTRGHSLRLLPTLTQGSGRQSHATSRQASRHQQPAQHQQAHVSSLQGPRQSPQRANVSSRQRTSQNRTNIGSDAYSQVLTPRLTNRAVRQRQNTTQPQHRKGAIPLISRTSLAAVLILFLSILIVAQFREGSKLEQHNEYVKRACVYMDTMFARWSSAWSTGDVRLRSRDDTQTPQIVDCVALPRDRLVVVDWGNNKIKLVDLTRQKIISQLSLSHYIWGIAKVSDTLVAVTSKHVIYFVSVTEMLDLEHSIHVKGESRGIACINDSFVVSFDNPVKVEMISQEGKLLQTVITENKGRELFMRPLYVAVSKDLQSIFISDPHAGTVTSTSLDGKVNAVYEDRQLSVPRGLAIDTTNIVYVCGRLSNNVMQMSSDLVRIQVLIAGRTRLQNPYSVCYCAETDRLFVGTGEKVKVYQMVRSIPVLLYKCLYSFFTLDM